MHFGFWRLGLNPLRREGMLVEMNRAVGRALKLDTPASPTQAQRRCVLDWAAAPAPPRARWSATTLRSARSP
jgi:hypothetical protein